MKRYSEFLGNHVIKFVLLSSIVSILFTIMTFQSYMALVLIFLGAVVYAIAEYIVHRYILHEFPKLFPVLYKEHVKHHQDPNNIKYLFSPVYYDILIYTIYLSVLWILFHDLSYIAPMAAGTLVFQLYYQWMHYAAHRPVAPRTRWGRWMKKKHLLHHFQDEHTWYGVSHPTLDFMMQTDKSKASDAK